MYIILLCSSRVHVASHNKFPWYSSLSSYILQLEHLDYCSGLKHIVTLSGSGNG